MGYGNGANLYDDDHLTDQTITNISSMVCICSIVGHISRNCRVDHRCVQCQPWFIWVIELFKSGKSNKLTRSRHIFQYYFSKLGKQCIKDKMYLTSTQFIAWHIISYHDFLKISKKFNRKNNSWNRYVFKGYAKKLSFSFTTLLLYKILLYLNGPFFYLAVHQITANTLTQIWSEH